MPASAESAPPVRRPRAPGQVAGAVPGPAEGPPVGQRVPGTRVVEQGEPQPDVAGQVVGAAAQHVAVLEQGGEQAGQPSLTVDPGPDDHARQAGVERQVDHLAAQPGRRVGLVGFERTQLDEQGAGVGQRAWRRRIEERQRRRIGAPHRELEGQSREVGVADLGIGERPPGGVLDLRPQPHGDPGPEASGPARPLVGRRLGRRHGVESGQAGAGIEHRPPGRPAVDDDRHALDGQARLGDVGGEHDLAPAGQARRQRGVLLAGGQRAVQHVDVDGLAVEGGAQLGLGAADLARPGQEHQHVALGLAAQDAADRAHDGRLEVLAGPSRLPAHVDRVGAALAGHDRRGLVLAAEQRGDAVAVERRRHHEEAQVGTQVTASVERQGQPEIGLQAALVELVEDDQADAVERGVALQPPGEDALGHHLDAGVGADGPVVAGAVADRVADPLAAHRGHPPGGRSCGEAPGFEHDDAAIAEPGLVQERGRDRRRLAGTRWRLEHGHASAGEGGAQIVEALEDRETHDPGAGGLTAGASTGGTSAAGTGPRAATSCSRARATRDRMVPTGQPQTSAAVA